MVCCISPCHRVCKQQKGKGGRGQGGQCVLTGRPIALFVVPSRSWHTCSPGPSAEAEELLQACNRHFPPVLQHTLPAQRCKCICHLPNGSLGWASRCCWRLPMGRGCSLLTGSPHHWQRDPGCPRPPSRARSAQHDVNRVRAYYRAGYA